MKIFGGKSTFGMSGSRRLGSKRRNIIQTEGAPLIEEQEEVIVAATESAPGELRRRTQQSVTEDVRWMRRGLFKAGFNSGAPRLRGVRKYTK